MYLNNKKVIFTQHAFERIKELQLNINQALSKLAEAKEYKLSKLDKGIAKYKRDKYKDQDNTHYYQNGTTIFTLVETDDFNSHSSIYLVVSVSDTMINLRNYGNI